MQVPPRDQKRMLDPQQLELQMAVSCIVEVLELNSSPLEEQ